MIAKISQLSPLMTPAEVAAYARVSREAVRRWRDAGKLPFVRTPGGKILYRRETVEALFAAETVGGAPRASPLPGFRTKQQKARDDRTAAGLAAAKQPS